MLVIEYDKLEADPLSFMQEICAHLEIDPAFFGARKEELTERIHGSKSAPPRPGITEHLKALYEPKIDSLGTYLGRDLSHWYK